MDRHRGRPPAPGRPPGDAHRRRGDAGPRALGLPAGLLGALRPAGRDRGAAAPAPVPVQPPAGGAGRGRRAGGAAPMTFAPHEWVAAAMLVALVLYALLGGADFGAGLWDLL